MLTSKFHSFIAILAFFLVIGLYTGCDTKEEVETNGEQTTTTDTPDKPAGDWSGDAPNFTLESVDGDMVSLSDYKGKVIFLDFWATWCPPCVRGIPDLVELQEKYGDDLQIIGISVDRDDTVGDVVPFVEKMNMNYPVVFFTDQVVQDYGGIEAIPTAFLLDKDGNIVEKYVGLQSKPTLEAAIDALL